LAEFSTLRPIETSNDGLNTITIPSVEMVKPVWSIYSAALKTLWWFGFLFSWHYQFSAGWWHQEFRHRNCWSQPDAIVSESQGGKNL